MLEFLKHAFILRNICYSTLALTILFTGSVLHEAGKYLRVGVLVLHVLAAFLIWIWLLPTDYVGAEFNLHPGYSIWATITALAMFAVLCIRLLGSGKHESAVRRCSTAHIVADSAQSG